jgi:hypothetical protein
VREHASADDARLKPFLGQDPRERGVDSFGDLLYGAL